MAQDKKRPYGSGCVIETGKGLAIRWRETIVHPDGHRRRVLRYEALGRVSRREAARVLRRKLGEAESPKAAPVTFGSLAEAWENAIVPLYKYSTRTSHVHILHKHLLPRFRHMELADLTKQRIQAFATELHGQGYAPHSVHHSHEVLSAVMRAAVQWGYLTENPAHGVSLPRLQLKRPKWVLTPEQAASLLEVLPEPSKTMATVALLTGLRRGELLALRWKSVDEENFRLIVSEAVYHRHFDTPKTTAGRRIVPIASPLLAILRQWKRKSKRREPEDLVFGARNGRPLSPNNLLQRQIAPACEKLGLPRATWITFRRTFSSWSHQQGIPDKLIAELMGHANVYTTLNVYTQVMDESRKVAAERVGNELFNIVQFPGNPRSGKQAVS